MTEESKIMSMDEAKKAIEKEDEMTETEKALAEAMSAGKESANEQALQKYLARNKQKETNTSPLDLRNAYNSAANTDTETMLAEANRIQEQQKKEEEARKAEKLMQMESQLEKTVQSGEAELNIDSKPEMKGEEKIIFSPDLQQEIEDDKRKSVIDALAEAQKAGKESIQADKEKKDVPSLEELTKRATKEIENKKTQQNIEPEMESALHIEPKEKLSDMLREDVAEEPIGTKMSPEWQDFEADLDKIPAKEELAILPEITELETLPIRGIGEMIKDTPMDEETKEWLQSKRGLLTKINNTEGSEKQKRELLLQDLQAELEEKQLELKRKWFFGKGELKKDIVRLNEIINNSGLFKQGEATILRKSSGISKGTGGDAGFARKV